MNDVVSWQSALITSWAQVWTSFLAIIPQILGAVLIFAIGLVLAYWVKRIVGDVLRFAKFESISKSLGVEDFLKKSGIALKSKPAFSRDTAFVLNRPALNNFALATTLKTKDADSVIDRGGRHVFIVPWMGRDRLMIGVWHVVWDKSEDQILVTEDEINEFISEVNEAYPYLELDRDDIALVNTGLTLFGEKTPGSKRMSFGKRSMLIDHKSTDGLDGVVTLIGVRATMGRAMAEQAINLISKKLDRDIPKSNSKYIPLYGGEFSSFNSLIREI